MGRIPWGKTGRIKHRKKNQKGGKVQGKIVSLCWYQERTGFQSDHYASKASKS